MRFITALFIICFMGKLVNCNNTDQSKLASSNDKSVVNDNQQPALESRQINTYTSNHLQDSSASKINIALTNLSPKETAHHNPNASPGFIKIQPYLAPFSSYHSPETSSSTTFLNFIKPTQTGGRRSSLTNKLKNYFSSLFWKDTSNSNPYSTPYMTSGSTYSFALKNPPPQFNFQTNQPSSGPSSNYVDASSLTSASQYKPVVLGNYPPGYQPDSNNYANKYMSLFNSNQYDTGSSGPSGVYSSPFLNSISSNSQANGYGSNAMNSPNLYLNSNSRNNNLNGSNKFYSGGHSNTGFPPSSYQVASASSNVNSVYTAPVSNGNQYSTNSNNQQDTNSNNNSFNNQRSSYPEISSPVNAKQQAPVFNSAADSSSSSAAVVNN